MATVLLPIPARDFDPTEVAVSWQVLSGLGHTVTFSTPSGSAGAGDELMVSGRGLDPWGWVPLLRNVTLIGRVLRANADGRAAYSELVRASAFRSPLPWGDVVASDYDGLVLPGGHRARGMRQYLESETVRDVVVGFFAAGKPVGAICHGVLAAARSIDPATGRSVLYGRRTTALTWELERTAWRVARRSRFWDPDYYRTYVEQAGQPAGFMSVQQEVTRALAEPSDFLDVDPAHPEARRKTSGRQRDTLEDSRPAWVVRDGSYVSARWPGDVHTFARTFSEVLSGLPSTSQQQPPNNPLKGP
jgi:putative intracellular protease/amidase